MLSQLVDEKATSLPTKDVSGVRLMSVFRSLTFSAVVEKVKAMSSL
jgi:hypothetical protein